MFNKKETVDILDILSNENLESFLNGLSWKWSDDGSKGIESVAIKDLQNKSLIFTFLTVQLISMNKNLKIGEYHYKVYGHSLSRTSPKIRKPDQSKVAYTIKRIMS